MKKMLFAICLLMALLLTGCGGSAESIDGVWQSDDAEYEFSEGLGRRINCVDGNIQSAEGFTYIVHEDTLTMVLADGTEQEYTWSVSGKKLKLTYGTDKLKLTAVKRESVPYLPDGYIGPLSVTMSFDGKRIELGELKSVQLLQLLRSGEVTEQGTAQPEELGDYMSYYIIEADGVVIQLVNEQLWVTDGDQMITYKLSNGWEIKEFLKDLAWHKAYPATLESGGFGATGVYSVTLVSGNDRQEIYLTKSDGEKLAALVAEGDGIGLFDGVYRDTYYEIRFLSDTQEHRVVRIYPDGTLRWDSAMYTLRNGDAVLQLLEDSNGDVYIVHVDDAITEWTDERGEFIHVGLRGLSNGGTAKWSSSNRSICTVEGNEHHGKIFMKGLGEAVITVKWSANGETGTESVTVTVVEDNGYDLLISPEDQKAAERLARRDYEAWRSEDWCLNMNVVESVVDKKETLRYQENYVGFREGWTAEHMTENAIVVRVTYDCQIDNSKIWYDDGRDMRYTYLTRADADSPWEITDYGPAG